MPDTEQSETTIKTESGHQAHRAEIPKAETAVRPPYDAEYYAEYYSPDGSALPYERNQHWLTFFGSIADNIVATIAPKTVFDAGCAIGLLVEALCERGVDAYGIDISEYAISQVDGSVRDRCRVGSIHEPFPAHYDLITCIEVLEHLEPEDAPAAVANLCAHADDILFTSTPSDFREPTHLNVQPPEYWAELFARHGFFHDVDYDPSYLAYWGMRFRRFRDPMSRAIAQLERAYWRLYLERRERNTLIMQQRDEIARLHDITKQGRHEMLERMVSEAQTRETELLRRCHELQREVDWLSHSRSFRIGRRITGSVRTVFPAGTRRADVAEHLARWVIRRARNQPMPAFTTHPDGRTSEYREWLAKHAPTARELYRMHFDSQTWLFRPLVSVILPVHNPDPVWVSEAVQSVRDQTYDNWELCIADDHSTRPGVAEALSQLAAEDPRIKLERRETNGGISVASNTALEHATGEFITFLDHDDILEPHALHALIEQLQSNPKLDFIYSDEDKLSVDGERVEPFFKPEWSPELMLSLNYITHMVLIRRTLIDDIGRFRSETDGAQDYDLFLRCTERTEHIAHVPDVLYTWRKVPGSAALSTEAKPWAYVAGKRTLEDAARRRGFEATVDDGPFLGSYSMHRRLPDAATVTILIPTRDRPDLLRRCIDSIRKRSTYRNYSICVVDNDSRLPETHAFLTTAGVRVVPAPGPFNYSKIVNAGVAASDSEYIILLNNDTSVLSPGWIEALLEQAMVDDVATVGARLLFPDGRPQHEGITVDGGPGLGPFNLKVPRAFLDLTVNMPVPREVSAVTAACMMVRASTWRKLGGFDERLAVSYNDVDFCLRALEAGYRNIYTPRAELEHAESASRGPLHPPEEQALFEARWTQGNGHRDRYTTPHVKWVDGRYRMV